MKLLSCWFLFAGLFVTGLAWAQSTSLTANQILPLLNQQMLASNAHDTDRFLAAYVHSPDLIFIANGQIIRGWDSLRQQQLKWWKDGKSDVVYAQQSQPEITALDPQTVLVTQQMTSHRTSPDGKPSDGTFIVTTIWRHLPVGWRVTYGHESWAR
jgi:ketosteroid isomerase-like protein